MKKLAQVLATEKQTKEQGNRTLTEVYHVLQKPALFTDMTRTYQPSEEGGEAIPTERNLVQHSVNQLLDLVGNAFASIADTEATKNRANTQTIVDVEVDGEVLLKDMDAPTLLFLENQLKKVLDEFKKLPILDPAYEWELDAATGLHRTAEPIEKIRTQKKQRGIVLYDATDKHPAQTQLVVEDIPVGKWSEVMHSGAVPAVRKRELLVRCTNIITAIASARQKANQVDAPPIEVGEKIADWILR
jgi:hypothetical protein